MAAAMFHMKHRASMDQGGSGGGLEGGKAHANPLKARFWRIGAKLLLGMALTAAAPLSAQSEAQPLPPPLPPRIVTFTDADTRTVGSSEVSRNFSYSWPAEVAAIPALVRRFTAERAKLLSEQKADFAEGLSFADAEGCVGCNRDISHDWSVIANTPRFLVLSGGTYVYSGGAHGNTTFEALVWDRKAKKALDPSRMFRSRDALQAALGEPWCARLKTERARRLGEEAGAAAEEDSLFPCPPIADLSVLPATSNGEQFDRIMLIAAPYVAGSYAEGVYAVTVPLTPEVLAAVGPRYKAAFVLPK